MWEQFGWLFMPGPQQDFMKKVPWKQLAVGERKKAVYHQ